MLNIILVGLGITIFIYSMTLFWRTYRILEETKISLLWIILAFLVIFFLLGYVAFEYLMITGEEILSFNTLVSQIFFWGAVFVLICAKLFHSTFIVRKQMEETLLISNKQLQQEIIDRKQTEKALEDSLMLMGQARQEWESSVDSIPQLICLIDSHGHVLRTNRVVEQWNLGQVVNVKSKSLHELLHPVCADSTCYWESFWSGAWEELKYGRPTECEVNDRVIGRYLHVQARATLPGVCRKDEETASYAVVVVSDITERKLAEEKINESEKKFKTIFDNATDGILLADIENKKFYLGNAAICQMLGYSSDEIKTLAIEGIHPEKDLPYVMEQFEKQRRKEIFIAKDIPLKKKDGSVIYVDINSVPITLGERTYMLGMFRDITDRRKAEEKLQAEKDRFWLAAQSLSDVVYEWDMGGSVQWFGNIDELLGYAPGEFPRTLEAWMDILHPEDQDRVWTAVEKHLRSEIAYEIEYRVRHNNGAWRHWLARGSVLRDTSGKPYRWVGAVTDITERKQAEEELTQYREHLEELIKARTAQLEAANRELEAFSYSVSHDLKAPLRAITGFSNILIEDYCDKLDDEGKRLLNVVRGNTEKMGGLIDDLLALSRIGRKEIERSKIDMDKLAKTVFDEIKATVPEREIQFDTTPLPPAYGDEGLLRQVFFNLLFNAIKFTRFRENAIIEAGGYVEGPENVYYVKDNGVGFDMQYAEKLFVAFQRLHSDKQFEGTGIGLATVQRIIHRHDGRIWAEGKVNEGATFYFTLLKKEELPLRREKVFI
jgi:PAS domain S-box-containing protein